MNRKLGKLSNRLNAFCHDNVQVIYTWKTFKLRSLFPLKDRVKHTNDVTYKGECVCKALYFDENKRNATRWKEHNSNSEKSEPSKHLVGNPTHEFHSIGL